MADTYEALESIPVTITMLDSEWALVTGATSALAELIASQRDPSLLPTQVVQSRSTLEKFNALVHQEVFKAYLGDASDHIEDVLKD
jgi:hypothetical protein